MYLKLSASNGRKDCHLVLLANWSQHAGYRVDGLTVDNDDHTWMELPFIQQKLMRGWEILDEFFHYFLNTGNLGADFFHPDKFPKNGIQLERWHLNSSVIVLALRSL